MNNEIRKVLKKGVNNGFLEKNGRKYHIQALGSKNEALVQNQNDHEKPPKKTRSRSMSRKASRTNYRNAESDQINLKDFLVDKSISRKASRTRSRSPILKKSSSIPNNSRNQPRKIRNVSESPSKKMAPPVTSQSTGTLRSILKKIF